MIADMERIRVYFDADEDVRLALKQEALDAGCSVSALLERLIKESFPEAIKEARKKLQQRKKQEGGE